MLSDINNTAEENTNGSNIVVISGPSGVGKSTICAELVQRIDSAFLSVSVTTRSSGAGEVNGKDYWFVSKEQFQERIENDDFLEYAEVFGNLYGTSRTETKKAMAEGKSVILEIDVQGGLLVKKVFKDAKMIFILPPVQGDLAERINGRARGEGAKATRERLENASQETAKAWQYYEYMIINDDLEQAVREIVQIIQRKIGENQ